MHLGCQNQSVSRPLMQESRRRLLRATTVVRAHRTIWVQVLISVTLALACLPSNVQGQQLDLATCTERLQENDTNADGILSKVEFINFMVRASPFGAACPDMSNIRDFLQGGKYYRALETASCYCQEYDADSSCCVTPALRVDGSYPQEYTERVCADISRVLTENCTPTISPSTQAPSANIIVSETGAPTLSPTQAPSANVNVGGDDSGDLDRDVPLDIEPYEDSEKEGLLDLPLWAHIVLVGVATLICFAFCALLLDNNRQRKNRSRYRRQQARGLNFEEDDHDSLKGYPEILEETDVEDTERNSVDMEEGAYNLGDKKVSWNEPLPKPQPKSPSRMSQVLDSLQLDETPMPDPHEVRKERRKSKSKSKKVKAGNSGTGSKKKKSKANNNKDDADPAKHMSEFVATLEDKNRRRLKALAAAPAPADPRERMGDFLRDSTSSDASASSAEIFVDEQEDEGSVLSGTTDSSAQIKWRLLHPTTLVNTGAVEVFPLPPAAAVASANIVVAHSSSSSNSPDSSGESKEAEEWDEDSVSDLYYTENSENSADYHIKEAQPDPDGVRLEDGRYYREEWLRQKDGSA